MTVALHSGVMRVALPTTAGRLSPVFDVAKRLLILDLGNGGEETARREEALTEIDTVRRVGQLCELGIDVLICSALSAPLEAMLEGAGVQVLARLCGETESVLRAFLLGALEGDAFRMPGCCARRRQRHGCGRGLGRGRGRATNRRGGKAMQVLITSQGPDLSSPVDLRFGRARYFVVVDVETGEARAHDNAQNLNAAQGAGIQAARNAAELGARALVTGHVGPKAFRALGAAGIEIYTGATGTVGQAFEAYKAGNLSRAQEATVEGHWQ